MEHCTCSWRVLGSIPGAGKSDPPGVWGWTYFPPSFPCLIINLLFQGRGYVATSVVVPFAGNPQERRGYSALPPTFGPREGKGDHGGQSWSGADPKGLPPPSTDPKMVVQNNGFCGRRRRRKFCFRHMAGGNFFVRPYVSLLKILRILWRNQKWLKSTKKDFDPNPASRSDLG